ncbi:ABC transporter permease [Nocardioides caldifontis]|uniref:ABC transporter permease n=1 Tax=Nocardioides caldifontis TaxID=2588938 RepID=UPI0011E05596|nr:ABC transporter permease [Nocardioides caldifontis]
MADTLARTVASSPPRRSGGLGGLWVPLVICFGFLYVPIAVLVAMSFNGGGSAFTWDGFSFRWYAELAGDGRLKSAAVTSLLVAGGATVVATVLGTLLAVGLARHTRSRLLEASAMAPAILPDLLLAIGLLSFFYVASVPKSTFTVLLAHAAFGTAFVVAVVRARLAGMDSSQEEASRDLGAGGFTTFVRITLPSIAPAVVAGALLVFTLSLDEFVIAFFTAGPTTQTLPIAVYSMVRTGVTPEINALATVLVAVSVLVVVVAARAIRVKERP